MSRNTLEGAFDELFALVDGTVTGLRSLDHEPRPGDKIRVASVTVSFAGMDADFWHLALRIYVDLGVNARQAQSDLMTLTVAVDRLMAAGFGPSVWTVGVHEDLDALVATCVLEVGRQDYY